MDIGKIVAMDSSAATRKNQVSTDIDVATKLFTFENGDVKVKITYRGENIEGNVFSGAMAMASSVWKKFIYPHPPWATSQMSVDQLDFSKDDGDALLILLQIAHLQFKHIPSKKLSPDKFHGVAKLCDLYDCVELVKPWLASWMSSVPFEPDPSEKEFDHRWLFSAWVFGNSDMFEDIAGSMTWHINNIGGLVVDEDNTYISLEDAKLPPGILEIMLKARKLLVKRAVHGAHLFIGELAANNIDCCTSDCDASLLGKLVRTLARMKLWPLAKIECCHLSAHALATALENVAEDSDRSSCGSDRRNFSTYMEPEMPTVMTKAHLKHMRIQAE